MFLPPDLLEKVYVKGSLVNTGSGFAFKIKNVVDSGTLGGMTSLAVDGTDVPLSAVTLKSPTREVKAADVTPRTSFPLQYGSTLTVTVEGEPLPTGEHTVAMTVNVLEAGRVQVKIKDVVE
jgi:hypothetical protein